MSQFQPAKGTLYVVATPIGHLGDLTPRAREVLSQVDAICAEDTRRTATLLREYGIRTALIAVHDHNEAQITHSLIERLQAGQSLALVSDAGTPMISDPGFHLVRAARQAGLRVSPIPGACAAIAALSVAGIASDRFCFEGFLPAKAAARRQRLQALLNESRTLIFYESAHRIEETLIDMVAIFGGQRPACLARELTKLFETVLGDTLEQITASVTASADQRKGEFVLIIGGAPEDTDSQLTEGKRLYEKLKAHMSPSQAAKIAAEISGAPRKALYGGAD